MAKAQMLDVWIVESKTVYREVPFSVVIDWVQQGRLLEEDRVRKTGDETWRKLGKVRALAAYFPKHEVDEADDQAEALAPVQLDFQFNKPKHEEDDEVDMIPLIDVSLVLLIFFMMVTPAISGGAFIPTPRTEHGVVYDDPEIIWIGVNFRDSDPSKEVVYFIGEGQDKPEEGNENLESLEQVMARIDEMLTDRPRVEITINANEAVPSGTIRKLILELEAPARRKKIVDVFTGVSEK